MADADTDAQRRSPVVAGAVGGVIEWYDFAIYGILAPTIAAKFFPEGDRLGALLATYGVFAIGFAARPLGALLFGYLGDRVGRRNALLASILVMGGCTVLMAVLPSYAHIGIAAPLLLTLLRVAQGLSVGGEFSGASVYLAEHAPPARRGFITSLAECAAIVGFLLGAAVGAVAAGVMGEAVMADWGWRVPFAIGGVLALGLLFVRRNMPESPEADIARQAETSPVVVLARDHWRSIALLTAIVMYGAVCFYMIFVYATSFLESEEKLSTAVTLDINTFGMALCLVAALASGYLSDRIGRRPIFFFYGAAGLVLSYPLFALMHHSDPLMVAVGQGGFGIIIGGVYGMIPATIAKIFPARVRCTGAAVGYNICLGLLGGTAPIIATWLVATTGHPLAPAWYLVAAAAILLVGTAVLKERAGQPI